MRIKRQLICLICFTGLLQAPAHAQEGDKPPTVEQRLDRIERLLSSQGLMDMLEQIRQLQQEVSELRGEIEVQNHKIDQLQQRQRNLYADIDQRLQRLESGGMAAAGGGQPAAGGDGGPPLTTLSPVTGLGPAGRSSDSALTVETTDDGDNAEQPAGDQQTAMAEPATPEQTSTEEGTDIQPAAVEQAADTSPVQIQAEYQEAFRLLKQSRYDQAIRSFTEFLSAYPDSEYADNAQYWLAEAYYVTRDFEPALEQYNKLVNNFPDSQKRTHGMLKIGYTLQELGRPEEAKAQLQKLMQEYPGTTAARLADERLQKINAGPPPQQPDGDSGQG